MAEIKVDATEVMAVKVVVAMLAGTVATLSPDPKAFLDKARKASLATASSLKLDLGGGPGEADSATKDKLKKVINEMFDGITIK